MKYLIFLTIAFVALASAADEWKPTPKDQGRALRDACFKDLAFTEEEVEKIRDEEFENDKTTKDFALCYVKKVGIFTDDKGFIADRVVAQLHQMGLAIQEARDALPGCIEESNTHSTSEEKVYHGIGCMYRKVGNKPRDD